MTTITCDLCDVPITDDNLGQSTELTVLCVDCLEKVLVDRGIIKDEENEYNLDTYLNDSSETK